MVHVYTLQNGLVVILEPLEHVESVAYDVFIPGGLTHDSPDCVGASLILPELTARGAGGLSSRELSNAFESLGIRHGESASQEHAVYRGSCLAENIEEALRLTALLIQQPGLPENELPSIKNSLLLDLRALEDNPSRKVSVELSKRYFPEPHNRPSLGTEAGIQNTSLERMQQMWQERYCPRGSILSIAGKFELEPLKEAIERYYGGWQGEGPTRIAYGDFPELTRAHIDYDSAQLQIMVAAPSTRFGEAHYYPAKLAAGILSGGMFGRLFIEVREKRGLCYSVYARHSANVEFGNVIAYAGTTPERAHETLEVMLEVMQGLAGTIEQDELNRARANLLSALIMGEESTSSRAASNASDYWIAGKVRGLDEIKDAISAVTIADIEEYIAAYPLDEYMVVTLGPKFLAVPEELK